MGQIPVRISKAEGLRTPSTFQQAQGTMEVAQIDNSRPLAAASREDPSVQLGQRRKRHGIRRHRLAYPMRMLRSIRRG